MRFATDVLDEDRNLVCVTVLPFLPVEGTVLDLCGKGQRRVTRVLCALTDHPRPDESFVLEIITELVPDQPAPPVSAAASAAELRARLPDTLFLLTMIHKGLMWVAPLGTPCEPQNPAWVLLGPAPAGTGGLLP